jgi:hypothetical protein
VRLRCLLLGLAGAAMAAAGLARPIDPPGPTAPAPHETSADVAAPFGLRPGTTADAFEAMRPRGRPNATGLRLITEPPKKHPAFPQYLVQFGPKTGLCAVKAIGWRFPGPDGETTRAAFDRIAAPLARRYGDYVRDDRIDPVSEFQTPSQWVEAIRRGERVYRAEWSVETDARLPEGLRAIVLEAIAEEGSSGIALTYVFDNIDRCNHEIKDKDDEAL